MENPHDVKVLSDFRSVPGGILIPTKLSIELSEELKEDNFNWNFVSDQPFRNREPLDDFQKESIKKFREEKHNEYWKGWNTRCYFTKKWFAYSRRMGNYEKTSHHRIRIPKHDDFKIMNYGATIAHSP